MTMTPREVPPGVPESLITPQGNVPAIGIPNSQDYARLIFAAPYFDQIPIAEIIQPSVTEAVEAVLPSLVPPYVDNAVLAGVQQYAVLLTGSTMSGPLFLNPLMPTADAQAATKAYVDTMLATAGIPEVPPVPVGQVWARETGQWTPISEAGGTFLPLSGGTMQGNINMSGNTLTNMAAVPAMPNGAAPAQWVLNQIASVSLYQGTWNADTNAPDLTQLSVRVNGYTWIAITTSPSGVVVSQPIPGLQGLTVYNGDTIIYSTVQGQFTAIHAGGLTLPEADGRYVQLAGSQMSGALLLNANASQNMQAVTYQQLETAVANTVTPDAPADGQAYLRVGVGTNRWVPGMPLAGGIFTGAVTLAGPGASGNNPVTVTQLNSAVSGVAAGLMPISGGTFTGAVILNGNATVALNPVPLQQLNAMVGSYAPLSGATFTGPVSLPTGSTVAGYAPLASPALTGSPTVNGSAIATSASLAAYLALAGGAMTGTITMNNSGLAALNTTGSVVAATGFFASLQGNPGGSNVVLTTHAVANGGLEVHGGNVNIETVGGSLGMWDSNGTSFNWGINSQNGSLYFSNSNTFGAMHCDAYGNLTILGALTQGSDETNKTNIAPIAQGISLVRALTPKSYAWLASPDQTRWGFIAQDVQGVIAPAVQQGPEHPDGSAGMLGLDTTAILAAVTMAVKQIDQRCSALETAAGITPPAEATA